MKQFILASFAALAAGAVLVADAGAFGVASPSADVEAEKVIRALYADFVKMWNEHDAEAMGAKWALDGDHVEPDGTVAKGRHEVKELLAKQHASVFAKTTLTLEISSVWFVSANVALIDGTYAVSGIQDLEGNPIPPRAGRLSSLLIQEKDDWWIAASRLMIPTSLPYKPSGE